jgi:hypothetical protein
MRTLKKAALIMFIALAMNNLCEAQQAGPVTNSKKTNPRTYPQISLGFMGGAIFPVGVMSESFKPGGDLGLDVGFRVNREVGFYGKFGYYFMSSKMSGAPVGSYLEFTAGPRYYFTKPNLKSTMFLEAGFGGYSFNQNSYLNPNDTAGGTISQIADTRPGVNAGIGANLALTDVVGILIKTKYNLIFTPNGSNSFVTAGAGIEFNLK